MLPQDEEYAGELAPEGGRQAVPPAAAKDPQQTHAAGPGVWGAPD